MKHECSWIAVGLALGPRSQFLKSLIDHFKTPEALLEAESEAVARLAPYMGRGVLSALKSERNYAAAERIALWCHQNGVTLLTPDHPHYPASLWEIAEPPAVLYALGKLPLPAGAPSVGIVGTRRTDAYGERVTYKLSFELAAAGTTVISGMAQGVDAIAAAAALDAGGHTVAVLGSGIDVVYPRTHQNLFREIATFGTVLTEFAPGTRPNGWNFPMRNRLISALSDALMVTEADEGSGSLITARYALLQGKALFAVPGDVDNPRSAGTNELLRSGASVVVCGEDVLVRFRFLHPEQKSLFVPPEAMQYAGVTAEKLRAHGVASVLDENGGNAAKSAKTHTVSAHSDHKVDGKAVEAADETSVENSLHMLEPRELEIYKLLPDGAFSMDHLTAQGISSGEAASVLTMLEIYALIESRPGGTYQKK